MPASSPRLNPSILLACNHTAEAAPFSPLPDRISAPVSTRRPTVTEYDVETAMALTIMALEEDLIPAQGAGDTLYVYASETEITHNMRRTLEIFDGDINEAIENIRTFVMEGVLDDAR